MSVRTSAYVRELEMINKYISKKAKALRIKNQIKQSDLARMLGMSRNAVSDMMDGTQGFTVRTLYLLCHIFKCRIDDLFPPQSKFRVAKGRRTKVFGFYQYELKLSK